MPKGVAQYIAYRCPLGPFGHRLRAFRQKSCCPSGAILASQSVTPKGGQRESLPQRGNDGAAQRAKARIAPEGQQRRVTIYAQRALWLLCPSLFGPFRHILRCPSYWRSVILPRRGAYIVLCTNLWGPLAYIAASGLQAKRNVLSLPLWGNPRNICPIRLCRIGQRE